MSGKRAMLLGAGCVIGALLVSNTTMGADIEGKISGAVGGGTTGQYVVGAVVGGGLGYVIGKFLLPAVAK